MHFSPFPCYTSRMKPKISLITLGVSDFQRSLRFYRDGLKFTPHQYKEGDEHVMFQLEGTWLALFPKKELAKMLE